MDDIEKVFDRLVVSQTQIVMLREQLLSMEKAHMNILDELSELSETHALLCSFYLMKLKHEEKSLAHECHMLKKFKEMQSQPKDDLENDDE